MKKSVGGNWRIAADDQLPAAIDGADRVVRADLGCLVKDHQVELDFRRVEIVLTASGLIMRQGLTRWRIDGMRAKRSRRGMCRRSC